MIDEAAERGTDLTQRLLAFARKQPLQPREVDVNSLVIEATNLLRPTLGEQVEVQIMLAGDAARALIDPSQLTNAILNLALNARDAMPDGGKLTIETSNVILDDSYVGIHSEVTAGPYVLIAVTDSGHGIPAGILDNVFEPFFTTKDVGKGSGLGLSMVYGFVKQSNGHIKIYSEAGHGTTVRIYLPQATGLAQPITDELAGTSILEGGDETILVVEDDDLVRTFVVGQIQSLGYVTLAAINADAALAVINSAQAIDLLFTDMIMPGSMNGRQLSDAALRRRPALKVLFTSGYTENTVIHYGRLDAGVLLLAKPYRKSDLARMIRSALGTDTKLQPPTPDPVGTGASKPSRTAA
jgi:CheY-like chemotaxis protein